MIYFADEIRQADEQAVEQGLPATALMERAAAAVATRLLIRPGQTVLVICGRGNNGGDGWVVARELAIRGCDVSVYAPFGEPKTEAARVHARYAANYVTRVERPRETDVIVDALFGVGFTGPLTAEAKEVIDWMNRAGCSIYSIDVPSGVPSDHALEFDGEAVRATRTYTLHGFKPSRFLKKTAPFYGECERVEIGLPHTSSWRVLDETSFDTSLWERDVFAHKTTYGHGRLIGGSKHLIGAPFLAGKASLRAGLGLLDLAIPHEAAGLVSMLPEAMYDSRDADIKRTYDAIAIGPGMIDEPALDQLWHQLKEGEIPLIVDAGALSPQRLKTTGALTITPHPGEFSRLTELSVTTIEDDRFRVARAFARQHRVHLILKGTYTLVVAPDGTGAVNTVEAPALAKGGSGDVLTGILLALWARRDRANASWDPNEQAVLWHALAAKRASQSIHPASVLASDVIEAIGTC